MPSKKFLKGFKHELANRAFALMTVRRMAGRLEGDPWFSFWKTYWDLEVLNARRYEAAALIWGLDPAPGFATKLKAWLVSSVPRCLMVVLVKFVLKETVAYAEWLRDLCSEGPSGASAFLDYMVEQEDLQIELMRMALAGRHREIAGYAEDFFLKYGHTIPKVGFGASPAAAGN
ncbi:MULTISPECIES: hypothetical protein [Pseudomonas]|uniref:hypothetical protein n=1 Tax=Pseudomonas TaxID=286 RepID=UPI000A02D1E2|nr:MULTISPECIES: hypothetical protein [Pseudomonas]NMZ57254.1 hypothetical protein [Pseudomonas nitroreducens]UCL84912.1 hypothetical protein LDJ84_18300 [Pseudomonas sp. HS-18]WEW96940.1 hypothetical protein P3T65_22280 [Pseudomonas nitroreducens]SNR96185.1 hypothetical protein SAMN05216209_0449 [Pseudomonas nitroreducens]